MKKLFILLLVLFFSCKKETTGPSVYNFTVIDEHTNLPLESCNVILRHTSWPAYHQDSIIGKTNSNGQFTYICDKISDNTPGNYDYYEIFFTNSNYYQSNETMVGQTHKIIDQLISLNKKAVIAIKARQIYPAPTSCTIGTYALYFYLSNGTYPCNDCRIFSDSISSVIYYYNYELLPSNKLTKVSWSTGCSSANGILNSPFQSKEVMIGYNDTTVFNIDY